MAERKSQAEQMGRQGLSAGTTKRPGAAPTIFESTGLGVEEEYDPKELEAAIGPKPTGIAAISEWNKKRKAWLDARKPKPKPTPTPEPKKVSAIGSILRRLG